MIQFKNQCSERNVDNTYYNVNNSIHTQLVSSRWWCVYELRKISYTNQISHYCEPHKSQKCDIQSGKRDIKSGNCDIITFLRNWKMFKMWLLFGPQVVIGLFVHPLNICNVPCWILMVCWNLKNYNNAKVPKNWIIE